LEELLPALGGVPFLTEAIRSLNVPGYAKRYLHIKKRERGFDEATFVGSFLMLNGAGDWPARCFVPVDC